VKRLLVVSHSQTGGTAALAEAVIAGARSDEIEGTDELEPVEVVPRDALEAGVDDVLGCAALILATPENFGYMSGALKYFFDRIYYPCLEHTRGRPYALVVKARDDGQGATRSVTRIVTGLAWREVQPPLIVIGPVGDDHMEAARELGLTVAASLAFDLY
jgi:multimeric flavodoxin WrbA